MRCITKGYLRKCPRCFDNHLNFAYCCRAPHKEWDAVAIAYILLAKIYALNSPKARH